MRTAISSSNREIEGRFGLRVGSRWVAVIPRIIATMSTLFGDHISMHCLRLRSARFVHAHLRGMAFDRQYTTHNAGYHSAELVSIAPAPNPRRETNLHLALSMYSIA